MIEKQMKTLNLKKGDPEILRAEIKKYFLNTWSTDELLYSQLKSDDVFYHRGDPLRHIILFYLGHTAVFFINKLFLAKMIDERIRPDFESTFAIGVDEMSWDDLDNNHYNWPQVKEVYNYRNDVKELILNLIDNLPLKVPVEKSDPFWIIMMGIEHAKIHLETSSVLIRQLDINNVVSGKFGEICKLKGESSEINMISVDADQMALGKSDDHPFYGWDNEYGKFSAQINAFKISNRLISNADYLKFIKAGGYHQQKYWTEEGWDWKTFKNAEMPLFWRMKADKFWLRLVADEIEMPWNWPVEVNYLEAKAYCNWKSETENKNFRLPTEAEWCKMYELSGLTDEWKDAPGNINLHHWSSPCPVNHYKNGDFYDVIGNVWQWTETPITGYQGFEVHPMYDDFSTPTFDGKHNLMKGGSWISTGNEATFHARYAFRRHFYQHAGIRLVESEYPLVIEEDKYETDADVCLSCENMWNLPDNENFYHHLAVEIQKTIPDLASKSVLDLNTDTGRLAFELAPTVQSIMAIDSSARFIRIPLQLKEKGFIRYIANDEGELVHYQELSLNQSGLGKGIENVQFMQDNANNLKEIYSGYDVVVLTSLLESLNCPILFLKSIHQRLNPGGWLVIASDYDWSKNKIDAKHWPGGFKKDGEPVTSFEGIREILSPYFELISQPVNIELVEKLNSRNKSIKTNEITFWKLK